MKRGPKVWYNGRILPAAEAKISLFTHALHYGFGVFEGIRAYRQNKGGGAVFRLQEHMDRLIESCKILDLKLPYSSQELSKSALDLCHANQFEECYIRPIAFTADGPLGVNPGTSPPIDVAILNWEWGKYLGDKGANEGARLKISSFVRPHVNSSMTKGKITGQYVNSVIAKREAIASGFDEALMLDPEGYLTEGTGENLFLVKKGNIKTTPLTSILDGITRQSVMEYFRDQGKTVQESRFTRDELWCADEVFLTGTAAEITPVREVDFRPIGKGESQGRTGPVASSLQREYQEIVRGGVAKYAEKWLTAIPK